MRLKLLIYIGSILSLLRVETGFAGSLHFDAGVMSDYVWRGLTQTQGKPAVNAGLEFVTDNYWYFGAWASNTHFEGYSYGSAELDLYLGLTGEGQTFGYDIGLINYRFPAYGGADFTEMYFALISEFFRFKYSDSSDAGTYLELDVTKPLAISEGASLIFHVGNYSVSRGESYRDFSVSLNAHDLTFTLSKAMVSNPQDKDLKAYISWTYSFK